MNLNKDKQSFYCISLVCTFFFLRILIIKITSLKSRNSQSFLDYPKNNAKAHIDCDRKDLAEADNSDKKNVL